MYDPLDYDYEPSNAYGEEDRDMSNASHFCKHGRYVGGCGVDWMCYECEMGHDQWYPVTLWMSLLVLKGERNNYVDIKKEFSTQQDAIDHNDRWERFISEGDGDKSRVIALIEYPYDTGYWGERERDKENHVNVYDLEKNQEYGVWYRFDEEREWLENQVVDVNNYIGKERFILTDVVMPFSVQEIVRVMQEEVEGYDYE